MLICSIAVLLYYHIVMNHIVPSAIDLRQQKVWTTSGYMSVSKAGSQKLKQPLGS